MNFTNKNLSCFHFFFGGESLENKSVSPDLQIINFFNKVSQFIDPLRDMPMTIFKKH